MNNDQLIHFNEYGRMEEYFATNATLINTFTPLKAKVALFTPAFATMRNHVAARVSDGGGIRTDKIAAKQAMADATASAGIIASDYFHDQHDEQTASLLEHSASYLFHLADGDSVGACKSVRDTLNAKLSLLSAYGIVAATITDLDAKMAAFQSKIPTPVTAGLGNDQTVGSIDSDIDTIEAILDSCDRLITKFNTTNHAAVVDYFARRKQIAVGIRHTGIKATLVDSDNNVITSGQMLIPAANKTMATDVSGIAYIKSMRSGVYAVTFKASGYVDQTMTLTIKRGSTLEISVTLVKVVV